MMVNVRFTDFDMSVLKSAIHSSIFKFCPGMIRGSVKRANKVFLYIILSILYLFHCILVATRCYPLRFIDYLRYPVFSFFDDKEKKLQIILVLKFPREFLEINLSPSAQQRIIWIQNPVVKCDLQCPYVLENILPNNTGYKKFKGLL